MLASVLKALVRAYQRFISPLFPPRCRFTPTCSQYAIEAIDEWGAVIGTALAASRVVRCNPFCRGGHDPVPRRLHPKNKKR